MSRYGEPLSDFEAHGFTREWLEVRFLPFFHLITALINLNLIVSFKGMYRQIPRNPFTGTVGSQEIMKYTYISYNPCPRTDFPSSVSWNKTGKTPR
jgi:hypothetical protein